jgi:hypothetical protein
VFLVFEPVAGVKFAVFVFADANPVSAFAIAHVVFPVAFVFVFVVVELYAVAVLFVVFPVADVLLRCRPLFAFDCAVFVFWLFLYPEDGFFGAVFLGFFVVAEKSV